MNAPSSRFRRGARRRAAFPPIRGSVLLWVLGSLVLAGGICGLCILDTLTLDREARLLREALVRGLEAHTTTKVQVSAGPFLLGGARTVLGFIDRVPTEAKQALRSVRAASVGVYRLNDDPERPYAQAVRRADAEMARLGWSRLVGVVDPGKKTCVVIYSPEKATTVAPLRLCVGVCEGRELVVVAAKVAPEELAELVDRHIRTVRR